MTTVDFLTSQEFLKQRALSAPALPVHPATEATAVIVPVLGRPQNAATFMGSLKASNTSLARVYAVVDWNESADVVQAWKDHGADLIQFYNVVWGDPGTFAQKVNAGYRNTAESWIFIAGDDVRFHPQWLDYAQDASRDGAHVIGTNDMHNTNVIFGLTATHLLIRRYYIDKRGASWDGPGVVCHEGYRHNGPDTEIVTAAQVRGVWAFARHSKVEHFHPFWGGAPDDDTYRLGASSLDQDMALWTKRRAEHAPMEV